MVSSGKFVLYDGFVPPLEAGDYELTTSQTLTSPNKSGLNVEAQKSRIRITSPRFKLPPDQILSAFPPANSEGAYESRLPQIVIKRRTMPWERRPLRPGDPAVDAEVDANTPWLALVVIAEGEGEISVEKPIAECVTQGVDMSGPSDVVKGLYLAVPETTVRKVFPTVADLRLLAQVREVSLDDTENAMGDDDGFMAVMLANRLPQFDRVNCKPVRYLACLINLEGQLHVLPPPTPPQLTFLATEFVFNATLATASARPSDPDHQFMGTKAEVRVDLSALEGDLPLPGPGFAADFEARSVLSSTSEAALGVPRHSASATTAAKSSEWNVTETQSRIATAAVSANSDDAAFVVRDAMKAGFRFPFEAFIAEKTFRFPVLAHWSFTCNGAGSLDTIMQDLDVGLLGTLPGPDATPPRPECLPPVAGEGPPPAEKPRVAPEVAETGHVGLAHKTRDGEDRRAGFRGPFTPFATKRRVTDESAPVLAHVSDQLRLTIPDGREDLSLAVAFEIGRLLALSQPSLVAALMRWRREQFGAERARRLNGKLVTSVDFARDVVATGVAAGIASRIGTGFVKISAKDPLAAFGDARPIADPGRPIEHLAANPLTDLAAGLAIDRAVLAEAQKSRDTGVLDRLGVAAAGKPEKLDEAALQTLDRALDTGLRSVLDAAFGEALVQRGAIRPERGDALDDAIRRTIDRRNRERK